VSWKLNDVPLLSVSPCSRWNRISGDPPSRLKPSSGYTMFVFLPIFLYGSEVCSATSMLSKKIDVLDKWCLRCILHIHWTDFVSNDEVSLVRSRTGQRFLSDTIRRRRLSFFGHLSRADISQDHSRALQACILGPPKDWRRRVGRP